MQQRRDALKVTLMGAVGVGKSSIRVALQSLYGVGSAPASETIQPTIGVDFVTLFVPPPPPMLQQQGAGASELPICLWDTSGMEKYAPIARVYARSSAAIILVWDVSRRETFTELLNVWRAPVAQSVSEALACGAPAPLVFVWANKCDLLLQGARGTCVMPPLTLERAAARSSLGCISPMAMVSAREPHTLREAFAGDVCNAFLSNLWMPPLRDAAAAAGRNYAYAHRVEFKHDDDNDGVPLLDMGQQRRRRKKSPPPPPLLPLHACDACCAHQ